VPEFEIAGKRRLTTNLAVTGSMKMLSPCSVSDRPVANATATGRDAVGWLVVCRWRLIEQ